MWYQSVIGQNKLLTALHESIARDTFSHAMIIEGSSGLGGLPIALSLSEHLLCTSNSQGGACGQCRSCVQVQKLIHPDLHIAFPVVRKDGVERKNTTSKDYMQDWRTKVLENPYITYNEWIRAIARKTANGDINVKECTEIIQHLNMQSFSGSRKVQIIWIADKLGTNGNKLLKIIEEPPVGTHIFLICDSIESMLMTITSRCGIIKLPRIDEAEIAGALEKNLSVDYRKAHQIAFICDGDFSVALEYVQLEQNNLMELCIEWMKICDQANFHACRQWATDFSRYNLEEQKALLIFFLKILHAIFYYNILGITHIRLSESDKEQLLKQSFLLRLSPDDIGILKDLISLMITRLERYVNGRMVMFEGCLTISMIFQKKKSNKSAFATS